MHPCCRGIEVFGVFLTVTNREEIKIERFIIENIPEQVDDQQELSEALPLHRKQTLSAVRDHFVVKNVDFISFDSSENENSEVFDENSEYFDK